MKILSFSYCFPNKQNENWGIFVYNRLKAKSEIENLKVCSPVPVFPLISKGASLVNRDCDIFKGLKVFRPGFFYFPMVFKSLDPFFYSLGLKKWLKDLCEKWKPDILDAHFIWPDGVAVSRLAKELGIPYTITLRGKIYESIKVESHKKQSAIALKNASGIISVSKPMAEEAVNLGADRNKIRVIPNGVDKDNFHIKDKEKAREILGLPLDKKILVTIAHLGHRKGHYEVIQALANLPENIILILIGGEAQGGTIKDLYNAAKKAGIAKRLIVTGPRPYDEIPLYFNAADASILASYREGCPNAVLESLACGTPVIATAVGAVPQILKVPETGRLVPVKAIKPIEEAISSLLNQAPEKEIVLSTSGVKSWNGVAEEVIGFFREIVR